MADQTLYNTSLTVAAKAGAIVTILTFAMLLPVTLIAWTCSKIYGKKH